MAQQKGLVAQLPLSGRLRTAPHGTQLGEGDFTSLINMRYGELSPKSIRGMEKINSSIVGATYNKIRQGFHFRKSQPSESHVMVQSFNSGLTQSALSKYTAAVPAAQNFADWVTDSAAGATVGRFSDAPDGCMLYTNGIETLVWGGDEYRCAGFVVSDLTETNQWDYTSQINNTLHDALNVATMHTTSGTVDSNTLLLLHMDGAAAGKVFTDSSPTTPHTFTSYGDAATMITNYKFPTASMYLDGSQDYITTPDDPDFDLSGGTWTIDFWMNHSGNTGADDEGLYFQSTDSTNYIKLNLVRTADATGQYIEFSICATTVVVTLASAAGSIVNGTWYHIQMVESGDNYYLFIDGMLAAETTSTSRPADYTGVVYIGYTTLGINPWNESYSGYIDEYRLSNNARSTVPFAPSTTEYGTTACYAYLASTRPITGAKFYVDTANAAASSAGVKRWYSGSWHEVAGLADATVSGSATLAVDGWITWTAATTDRPVYLFGKYAYWYLFTFSGITDTTKISYITVQAPIQNVVDLWDGIERTVASFLRWNTTNSCYYDRTVDVFKEDYLGADVLTYIDVSDLPVAEYLLPGFDERMTGLKFTIPPNKENTTKCSMTVYYWNGSAWTAVTGLKDGTRYNDRSFKKSGVVTWDAPDISSEFKRSISVGASRYYYKVKFNAILSSTVYVDYIAGIPAQKDLLKYDYCTMWQNRPVLVCETNKKKNSILVGSKDTVCVFNGEDSAELTIGGDEKVVAAAPIFTRFGGSVYEDLVVFKQNEVWILSGTDPDGYIFYKISDNYGCVAPGTLKSCNTGYEISPGLMKHILMWQSENATCMFDGNSVGSISDDIKNLFSKDETVGVTFASANLSEAFFDQTENEYHWLFLEKSSGIMAEYVYDVKKKKWFTIERGGVVTDVLYCGFPVRDTNGVSYTFGCLNTGYVLRLEYKTDMNDTAYTASFKTGDIALGGWTKQTKIRKIKHFARSKAVTTNATLTISHYGDTISTTTDSSVTSDITSTTNGIVINNESVNWGNHIFHRINCSVAISTVDLSDTVGYQPIGIALIYDVVRDDTLVGL